MLLDRVITPEEQAYNEATAKLGRLQRELETMPLTFSYVPSSESNLDAIVTRQALLPKLIDAQKLVVLRHRQSYQARQAQDAEAEIATLCQERDALQAQIDEIQKRLAPIQQRLSRVVPYAQGVRSDSRITAAELARAIVAQTN